VTPEEIAALSACFRCIADRQAALLFLLARIADVTIEEIIAGSACFRCISDFNAAELFLLNSIATDTAAAAAAAGQVQCGPADPVAPPPGGCAIYYNTTSTAEFQWIAPNWVFKV
jgi:hypothetical protein